MYQQIRIPSYMAFLAFWLLAAEAAGWGQGQVDPAPAPDLRTVVEEMKSLQQSLASAREELRESRQEIEQLRSTVSALQASLAKQFPDSASGETNTQPSQTAATDEVQLLAERVNEQQQTKVESASKLRVKISGLVLLNAFSNSGRVDNVDVPAMASLSPALAALGSGSIGGSMRQSILGVTGFGPRLLGAATSGDVQLDFFGGFSSAYSSPETGQARLRLARLRLDWRNTSVAGGIDTPFFSPNSPTSYATVAEPAFSASGNLWSWTPSLRVEHRFSFEKTFWQVQAGIFDPAGYTVFASDVRYPTPGEAARQPAYSARVSFNHGDSLHRLSIGVAGLFMPLRFYDGSRVDGAGGMVDWQIPATSHFELSGEFFAGHGLQTFGGVGYGSLTSQDTYNYVYSSAPALAGLHELGGWSQLKFKVNEKNEFNFAAGYGGYDSVELRQAGLDDSYLARVPARNETLFANYIIHPKSDLLFALEYRRLKTVAATGSPANADHVGVAAGFLF